MRIIWFKRDLRIHDSAALAMASEKGSCFLLSIPEPALSLVTLAQTALCLAHLFVDYGPGFHYPQMQMQMQRQSGTMALYSTRI